MVDISTREKLEDFLREQGRDATVLLAVRAALRVLPVLGGPSHVTRRASDDLLPVLRGIVAPWVACAYPSQGRDLLLTLAAADDAAAADTGGDDEVDADEVAYAAAAAYAATAAAYAYTYAYAESNTADAAEAAAKAAYAANAAASNDDAAAAVSGAVGYVLGEGSSAPPSRNDVVAAAQSDADIIAAGLSATELARRPLWPGGASGALGGQWERFKRELLAEDSNWSVWTAWYDARLRGEAPEPPEVERARVTLAEEVWRRGAAVANAEIAQRLEDARRGVAGQLVVPAEPLPAQSPGPHFGVGEDGLIERAPPHDIDASGNDLTRLAQLRPLVRYCAAELASHVQGNKHRELEQILTMYVAALAPEDYDAVPWGTVFGLGVMLQNTADAARREIADRLSPELEDAAKAALDSLLMLHGPMILATREGRSLAAAAESFQMTRDEVARMEAAARALVERLRASEDVAKPEVKGDVALAVAAMDQGRHPERGTIYGMATVRNLVLVAVAAAVMSPPVVGTLLVGTSGAFVGGLLSFAGLEGLKKSTRFQAIATQIGARIDAMTGAELGAWVRERMRAAAPFRTFVLRNEAELRRIAETTPQLGRLIGYIELIKSAAATEGDGKPV